MEGYTLLPGIIDAHLHATWRARDVRRQLQTTSSYSIIKSLSILKETLFAGVTSARDMGGADAGFRLALQEGIIPGPRLFVSILMISPTGGHGDHFFPSGVRLAKRPWLPSNIADGVDGVRRLVRETLSLGADFIKLCASGGITSAGDDFEDEQFSVEEMAVAVREAAGRKKHVAAHAENAASVRNALAAGVHSIEHGWFMDEESVDSMVRRKTWWVPTLALVDQSLKFRAKNAQWSQAQLADEAKAEVRILARQKESIPLWREAIRRGVRIAFGTDQSHRLLTGRNLVELEYMVDWLGMSPLQAVNSATGEAARCIGVSDIGVLEEGRRADFIAVQGDPLRDIRILGDPENVRLVVKDGVVVKNTLAAAQRQSAGPGFEDESLPGSSIFPS
jgi:imidazolonepropionase-like amidohydrolase